MDEKHTQDAKASGRGRVQPADLGLYVVDHLDQAIEEGWIKVYCQPVVRTVTGKLCSMEALARWDDPNYGLLNPGVFIEALEEARLIHKLDMHMVHRICKRLGERMAANEPVVPVSFNLSRLDFDLCDILSVIEREVHAFEVPRRLLNIEITESVFGSDPLFIATTINDFHDLGYQVWMDDFGSAYSSLNVLKDFDFDVLKIDMGFLSRFDEKSRTIVASVVDMAKRLGIQTLAEGVETVEHQEFLRHIGCEKQQGYLYSRPQPFSSDFVDGCFRDLGVESINERRYYHAIGQVNTLSLSEDDFMSENESRDYVTSMPLAFIEYDGRNFAILDCNEPFLEALRALGIPDANAAERMANESTGLIARNARRLVEGIEQKRFSHQDYMINGCLCVVRCKFVSSLRNRVTMLVTVDSAMRVSERKRDNRRLETLESLYSIYERVDILHLDDDYLEPVYSQSSFEKLYQMRGIAEVVNAFADNALFPADRGRFVDFMDPGTLAQRVDAHVQGYLVDFFRMRDRGGDYVWKMVTLIRLLGRAGNELMGCIRDTNWDNDALLQSAYDQAEEEDVLGLDVADLRMTDGSLWRSIIHSPGLNVFWKDADRRFVGCNQAFLDYYGFASVDEILGKTDEEMGWHVNPVPFMNDELRVIEEGVSTDFELGHCIARGTLRDIVASKRPVYRNGRIVGLVGFFFDVGESKLSSPQMHSYHYRDPITGVLNYNGLDATIARYIESYQRNGTDFVLMLLVVDMFSTLKEQYGYEFEDKLLRVVADKICEVVGTTCVVGHIYADHFVVLLQDETDEEAQGVGTRIVDALAAIPEVDGIPFTVFARHSEARFSEVKDSRELHRLARARLIRREMGR